MPLFSKEKASGGVVEEIISCERESSVLDMILMKQNQQWFQKSVITIVLQIGGYIFRIENMKM